MIHLVASSYSELTKRLNTSVAKYSLSFFLGPSRETLERRKWPRKRTRCEAGSSSVIVKHECGLRTADCGLRTADCGLRTGGKTRTRYKMRTTDYIGKNCTNWSYVRLNKFKRSLNSTTRKFNKLLMILLEILGAWRCAARFSKFRAWPKCYFLQPFSDLVSVLNIYGRGYKCDAHVYICVNHVIIA